MRVQKILRITGFQVFKLCCFKIWFGGWFCLVVGCFSPRFQKGSQNLKHYRFPHWIYYTRVHRAPRYKQMDFQAKSIEQELEEWVHKRQWWGWPAKGSSPFVIEIDVDQVDKMDFNFWYTQMYLICSFWRGWIRSTIHHRQTKGETEREHNIKGKIKKKAQRWKEKLRKKHKDETRTKFKEI